jgi:hypothetical protein
VVPGTTHHSTSLRERRQRACLACLIQWYLSVSVYGEMGCLFLKTLAFLVPPSPHSSRRRQIGAFRYHHQSQRYMYKCIWMRKLTTGSELGWGR